ncbi:MAG: glycosyltransferase family 39 protein [Vicinamibacterales bacterium]
MLVSVCTLLALAAYLPRFSLLYTRTFDPDEFQHLHATWAVSQRLVPFRDFFEHHMPAMQLLLAPVMQHFDVNGSAEGAVDFMFVARLMMAICAGAAVVLTWILAARPRDPQTPFIAVALLSTSIVFLGRTLEIRPDTPSLPFWIAALCALSRGSEPGDVESRRTWWFVVAGLCFGVALTFNQKLLLAGPGLAVWGAIYLFDRNRSGVMASNADRVIRLMLFGTTAAVPLLLIVGWFGVHGALRDMIHGTLIGNLGWPREVAASSTIRWMALRDPALSALMVGGFLHQALTMMREGGMGRDSAAWCAGVSLIGLLFVTPTPFPQYMLLVLPIGAVFAARMLWAMVTTWPRGQALVPGGRPLDAVIVVAGIMVTLTAALEIARPFFVHPAVYPAVALLALVWSVVFSRRMHPGIALAALLAVSAIYPLQQVRWMEGLSNRDQLAAIRALHTETTSSTTVLDGFTGLAWFRPYASYYGFLHPGVRAFLSEPAKASIVAELSQCDAPPGVVILDVNLRALSPEVEEFVRRRYHPGSVPDTWLRNEPDSSPCEDHPSGKYSR